MSTDATNPLASEVDEQESRLWKTIALGSLTICAVLLALLFSTVVNAGRLSLLGDPRLFGTWQSDADRTMAAIPYLDAQPQKIAQQLTSMFGKLRVTWSAGQCVSQIDESEEIGRYRILAADEHSVVVEHLKTAKPSPIEELGLPLSRFTVIHFEDPETYWVDTELGGIREYFRRVEP